MPQPDKRVELMAPAGDWTMLSAVLHSGADAVYLGLDQLNMRMRAGNFSLKDIPEIVRQADSFHAKVYVTLNVFVREEEILQLEHVLDHLRNSGIEAVICWDMAVIQACKKRGIPFCISTQASVSNSLSARFYQDLGARRVVLARECTLDEIRAIRKNTSIEIEAFIHGAMCVAVSGRCFLSHDMFTKSANRGECNQPCRREYEIKDTVNGTAYILGEDALLSAKDLNALPFLEQLIEAGIDSFKIEGRKRSPEYAAVVVSVYRRALDAYYNGTLTPELKQSLFSKLETVFNKGYSSGFYFGKPDGSGFAAAKGNASPIVKEYTGLVRNYFKQAKAIDVLIEAGSIRIGDTLLIIGKTTGVETVPVETMFNDTGSIDSAKKGDRVTIAYDTQVRPHDKVYVLRETGIPPSEI